jgi:hypothetical protein
MDEKRHTSYTLKPEDTASKIPNILAFTIYRLLPIGILSFLIYKTHTEIELDMNQWNKCVISWDIACIFYFCGYGYSEKYDCCWLEQSGSRQEWVDTLNSKIEKWIRGCGSRLRWLRPVESEKKLIQCEKEIIAAGVAGSRQGVPSLYIGIEDCYQLPMYLVSTYIALRLACAYVLPVFAQFTIWNSIFLYSFLFGRQLRWSQSICAAVFNIRKKCESIDVEKGEGMRNQLEWWVEAILKEESDSSTLAVERKEVIIVPILRAIRC